MVTDPLYLECADLLVHPFRPEDLERYGELAAAVFALFSDEDLLTFLPEKRLDSLQAAEDWLKVAMLDHYAGRNQVHFIREKSSDRLLGIIDIIMPLKAKQHYRLPSYPYFLEFYLGGWARGRSVMSTLLPLVIGKLRAQGIGRIGGVVNRRNLRATKVLARAGFVLHAPFDVLQDLYLMD